MKQKSYTNSQIINGTAFGFSAAFLISAWIAAIYTGEWGSVFSNEGGVLCINIPTDSLKSGITLRGGKQLY